MTARILDGRSIAKSILTSVAERAAHLHQRGINPHMAFVTVGQSEPAQIYAARLEKQAARNGIDFSRRELDARISAQGLDQAVAELNQDETLDGIIVQMPLPGHLSALDLSRILSPHKDVDGITIENSGRLYLGHPGRFPSTAVAMMEILAAAGVNPNGKRAVVVGRSPVVGHPVAELLLRRNATVTIAHSRTKDLGRHTREAEILMVAVGRARLITRDMVGPSTVVIDAGTNAEADGLVGDVDFDGVSEVAEAITPVPGGVGPVNNAVLLRSVIDSAEERIA